MGTSVVGGGHSPKALLPSGIPHLQFHLGVLVVECTRFAVNTNCSLIGLISLIDSGSEEEGGLTTHGVTNDDDLEEEVVCLTTVHV